MRRNQKTFISSKYLSMLGSGTILMVLFVFLWGDTFLRAYHPGIQVYAYASDYLIWMKFAVLLLPLNELLDGMLFADGDETISLAANLAQGCVKIILSVVLCRSMGVQGLVLASVISFAVSILISCVHFFRPGNTLRLNLAFSPVILRNIMKYGIVDAGTHLSLSWFTFAMNFFVMRIFGPEKLILVSVIALLRESQILFEGIGEAITPLMSMYLGEKCYPGVRRVWKLAVWSVRAESLLATAFLFVSAPAVVSLIGIRDPLTALCAVRGLRIMSLTLIFSCRLFLDSSYFILVDNIRLGVLDTCLRELVPALPLAALGGLLGGTDGMYIGLMVSPVLGYVLSVLYIGHRYDRDSYPLLLKGVEEGRHVRLFEFCVRPDAVTHVRDMIGETMKEYGCADQVTGRTMVIFEELFMLIHDCNPGRTVHAECSVEIGKSIRLITKDDGRIVDLTQTDRDISSLRAYTLASMLKSHAVRRMHSLALSYNHNVLEIR